MKVLFATTNPAKVKRYATKLQERGIEVLTLKDIDLKLEVEETGQNAIENATDMLAMIQEMNRKYF